MGFRLTDDTGLTAATHMIPTANLPRLQAQVDSINRRIEGQGLDSDPFTIEVHRGRPVVRLPGRQVERTWVTLIGATPRYNGWELWARYDHTGGPALAQSVPGVDIPHSMLERSDSTCQHCGKHRSRSATFLLCHVETGELIMVGRSCLKDFLGHRSPEQLANLYKWYEQGAFEGFAGEMPGVRYDAMYPIRWELALTAGAVRAFGYTSIAKARANASDDDAPANASTWATVSQVNFMWHGPRPTHWQAARDWERMRREARPTDEDVAVAERVMELIRGLGGHDEYGFKLKRILEHSDGMVAEKHVNLLRSAITLHLREQWERERAEREEARRAAKASAKPIEEGRQVIDGRVVSSRWQGNAMGQESFKVLLEDDCGRRYWGTCPGVLVAEVEGGELERIQVRATVQASRDDRYFGYFKRPHALANAAENAA